MADKLTPEQRSAHMSRIRSRDTKPEMVVRKALHRMGFRFRLQARELPGRPDIVMRPRRVAVFVHGCFWHQHPGCRGSRSPGSNTDYWIHKLQRNAERDATALAALRAAGWRTLVIWECEAKPGDELEARLRSFLDAAGD